MPRFVVLRHDHPRGLHFDFMLEQDGVLITWALAEPPDKNRDQPADALADHRLAYLDYEGPVSGGRGSVARWDEGTYAVLHQSSEEWHVRLAGRKLVGDLTLRREGDRWRFAFSGE
jgi:hypothetical protein